MKYRLVHGVPSFISSWGPISIPKSITSSIPSAYSECLFRVLIQVPFLALIQVVLQDSFLIRALSLSYLPVIIEPSASPSSVPSLDHITSGAPNTVPSSSFMQSLSPIYVPSLESSFRPSGTLSSSPSSVPSFIPSSILQAHTNCDYGCLMWQQ